ncbi:MAG: type II toxin-antitoxin system HicA family toxin [Acidobacteria bacterium]|nr:type II toxin-antitoxin system HicA family toxin [Acidobacteriota bacterium]
MTHGLPSLTPRKVIRALERGGFFIHHTTGSHYALRHSHHPSLRVVVPYHNSDLKRGTLRSIIKQTGLTVEEFVQLL